MAEKSSAKAKPAPKGGKPKGKKGGGNRLAWAVLVGLAAGLAWVVWPFFGAPPASVTAQKQAAQQLRQITVQNPEAEVFNPEGKDPGADAVKKK